LRAGHPGETDEQQRTSVEMAQQDDADDRMTTEVTPTEMVAVSAAPAAAAR